MTNRFYSFNIVDSSDSSKAIELFANPGIITPYSLGLPNVAPSNDQSLHYNDTTGIFEWRRTARNNRTTPIVFSDTEPTTKVDKMLWHEINNIHNVSFWEWDNTNSLWWSNRKYIQFNLNQLNSVTSGGVASSCYTAVVSGAEPAPIRKYILDSFYLSLTPSVAHSSSIYYQYLLRYINNVGGFVDLAAKNTTNYLNAFGVYRESISLTSFNTAGSGAFKYVDNVFTFLINVTPVGGDLGSRWPWGYLRINYRHERL